MQMKRHIVLNHIDTPLKILFWTTGELLMLIVPCFVGLIINQVVLGLTISVFSFWLSKKYQQHFGKGQFQAVKYWFLPQDRRFKSLMPSCAREYIG